MIDFDEKFCFDEAFVKLTKKSRRPPVDPEMV